MFSVPVSAGEFTDTESLALIFNNSFAQRKIPLLWLDCGPRPIQPLRWALHGTADLTQHRTRRDWVKWRKGPKLMKVHVLGQAQGHGVRPTPCPKRQWLWGHTEMKYVQGQCSHGMTLCSAVPRGWWLWRKCGFSLKAEKITHSFLNSSLPFTFFSTQRLRWSILF